MEKQEPTENDNEGVIHFTRTYSLKTKDGKYAWVFDDDGSILEDRSFDSIEQAKWWHAERHGTIDQPKTWVKFLPNG